MCTSSEDKGNFGLLEALFWTIRIRFWPVSVCGRWSLLCMVLCDARGARVGGSAVDMMVGFKCVGEEPCSGVASKFGAAAWCTV